MASQFADAQLINNSTYCDFDEILASNSINMWTACRHHHGQVRGLIYKTS